MNWREVATMLCQKLAESTQFLRGEEGVLFFGEEGCLSVFKENLCTGEISDWYKLHHRYTCVPMSPTHC